MHTDIRALADHFLMALPNINTNSDASGVTSDASGVHRTQSYWRQCRLQTIYIGLNTDSPVKLSSHRTLNSDTSELIPDASGVQRKLFFQLNALHFLPLPCANTKVCQHLCTLLNFDPIASCALASNAILMQQVDGIASIVTF